MKLPWKICLILTLIAFAGTTVVRAQGVTTSAMTGTVMDSTNIPLAGAHVAAVHVPSGTSYSATTLSNGRFTIPGMRVGGPYRVTVSMVGYRRQVQDNINLTLGVAADVNFVMGQVSIELEAINVSGKADAVFSSERTGAATSVATEQLAAMPTVSRQVDDMLRLVPQFSSVGFGYSFAGQQDYFNNMTIDGSYFNNSFGLAGEPGGRTGVAAVSLDALEQIEVNVAPYDVRQGNFVGAGVNMVTKSGTNDYTGSIYYGFRSSRYVGTQAGPNAFQSGTFDYHNIGINVGGPILKNKLFFFASWEQDLQTSPGTTYQANTGTAAALTPVTGNITRVLASDLNALSTYLATNFHYNTGPYQGYNFNVPSNRFLVRLDYNINDRNKISLKYNVLNSSSDILISNSSSLGLGSRRSSLNSLNFANSNYAILENIRSTVAEWNSTIGSKMSNNLIVGYTSNDENRNNVAPPWFPEVEILQGGTNYTTFGFEPFTPDNQLIYHSFQVQDNYNIYLPKHTLTFGFSAEQYHSKNVFFPGAQSVYVYDSLAQFYRDAERLYRPVRRVHGWQRPLHSHRAVDGAPAPLPVPVREHPRADGAGPAAGRAVRRRVRAGRVPADAGPDGHRGAAGGRAEVREHGVRQRDRGHDALPQRGRLDRPVQQRRAAAGQSPALPASGHQLRRAGEAPDPAPRRHRRLLRPARVRLDLEPGG